VVRHGRVRLWDLVGIPVLINGIFGPVVASAVNNRVGKYCSRGLENERRKMVRSGTQGTAGSPPSRTSRQNAGTPS
jgi:hypothetical protein